MWWWSAGACFGDEQKAALIRAEPRITLLLEQHVNAAEVSHGRITSVVAQHIRTARRIRVTGALFVDCTGDATVGFLAGADFEAADSGKMGASNLWNLLDTADQKQVLNCECKDKEALSTALQAGKPAAVLYTVAGSGGTVHIDAVQVVPAQ